MLQDESAESKEVKNPTLISLQSLLNARENVTESHKKPETSKNILKKIESLQNWESPQENGNFKLQLCSESYS